MSMVERVQRWAGYTAGATLFIPAMGIYWLAITLGRDSLWWVALAPVAMPIQFAAMRHIEHIWKARR